MAVQLSEEGLMDEARVKQIFWEEMKRIARPDPIDWCLCASHRGHFEGFDFCAKCGKMKGEVWSAKRQAATSPASSAPTRGPATPPSQWPGVNLDSVQTWSGLISTTGYSNSPQPGPESSESPSQPSSTPAQTSTTPTASGPSTAAGSTGEDVSDPWNDIPNEWHRSRLHQAIRTEAENHGSGIYRAYDVADAVFKCMAAEECG